MKVAIIGAGVSGLSSACELVRNGVKPVVFERKSFIGDQLQYSGIWPRQITFPVKDAINYLKSEFDLEIIPMSKLMEIEMLSPERKTRIKGELGYIFKRGRESYSLENQIASKLNIPVLFDTHIEIEDIKESFDKIIVATGNNNIAKQLGVWTDTFVAQTRVATVLGNFDPNCIKIWFDTRYAKNAFCYLVANNPKEASLVMVVNGVTHYELFYYWDLFISEENISYDLVEIRDTESSCGFVEPLQKEHIYFVGNTGGFTDDFIGVGAFNAILSGIYAARAIVGNKSYDDLCKPLYSEIIKLNELRKTMNTMDNGEFDVLLSLLGAPLVKKYVYNNPFFKVSDKADAAKIYRSAKKRIKINF